MLNALFTDNYNLLPLYFLNFVIYFTVVWLKNISCAIVSACECISRTRAWELLFDGSLSWFDSAPSKITVTFLLNRNANGTNTLHYSDTVRFNYVTKSESGVKIGIIETVIVSLFLSLSFFLSLSVRVPTFCASPLAPSVVHSLLLKGPSNLGHTIWIPFSETWVQLTYSCLNIIRQK